jgi:hypothetical protein
MIDMSHRKVQWGKPAVLQYLHNGERVLWTGEQRFDGTVAGAVRYFAAQSPADQERIEMFTDRDVIEGMDLAIIGPDVLRALASRPDLPQ